MRLFQKRYPELDWIQVEISSHCNASCRYCPHTEYKKNWRHRHLPADIFKRLIPAFAHTRLIHLQGWGEPFLHPDLLQMLRCAKKAGCMVGTTTNATQLNAEIIEKLVADGLDVIGFSLAGVDAKNDVIRSGTSLRQTLKGIDMFHRAKAKLHSATPKIHVAYMLLKSGLDDLEKIPAFMVDSGADQTVVSSLSLAVNKQMAAESILASGDREIRVLTARLAEVKRAAAGRDLQIHFHIVFPGTGTFSCSENVTRAIVVGSNGSVSPCVFLQMPAKGKIFFYFSGKKMIQQNASYGVITADPLNNIWHHKDYQRFRRSHRQGIAPPYCSGCLKGFIVNSLQTRGSGDFSSSG